MAARGNGGGVAPQVVTVSPIVVLLQNCQWKITDERLDGGQRVKRLLFIHNSGALAYQADLPLPMAKDVGTRLCAPAGMTIPDPPTVI